MSATETRQAIESILMVADTPVDPTVLAQLLEVPKADVEAMCDELAAEYESSGRGFILARVAGGYRFQSHPDLAPYVERFVLDGQTSRLSSAALETLAIVAYKQPISRMQIAAIRGVNVDGVLRTLQQRGYVDEVSRDAGPGNAVLFGTTDMFLERVGLDSTADLPPLAEFVPGADVVEALEDGLRPDPVEPPAAAATDGPEVHEIADEARSTPDEVEAEGETPEVADVEPESEVDEVEAEDETPEVADVEPESEVDEVEAEGETPEVANVEPESEVDEVEAEGETPEVADVEPESEVDEVEAEGETPEVANVEPESEVDEVEAEGETPEVADVEPDAGELHEVALGDEEIESVELMVAEPDASASDDTQADPVEPPAPAAPEAEADEAEVADEQDLPDLDEVIDLVAEEAPEVEVIEVIERPTELEEELAAIDALHAEVAEADSDDTPSWSPAESSAVATVRHDDPPEAAPAAPFRSALGDGGAGTEAGPSGTDLAPGEDLGAGEDSPLTGPELGDD